MQLSQAHIDVSVGTQSLSLWEGRRLVKQWPCSTSGFGIGFQEGSHKTPVGAFRIAEKHGAGGTPHTIYKGRVAVGEWNPANPSHEDLILCRILWLEGIEQRNANTKVRYIYIHGTNQEDQIGQAGSHGCVRMRNADVAELFDLAAVGVPVWIGE